MMQVYVHVSMFVVIRQNLIKYGLLKAYIFHRHGLLRVFCSTNSGNKTNDTIHTYVFHQDSNCQKKQNDHNSIETLPLTIISERQHPGQYKQEHTKFKLGSKEYLFIAIQPNQHLPAALQI